MREVTNARQNRGRSLPALVQFFQTPRANECAYSKVVVKPSQRFSREHERDETCANFRIIISLLRSKDAHHEETQRRNKESASSKTYLVGPQGDVRSIDVTILLDRVRGGYRGGSGGIEVRGFVYRDLVRAQVKGVLNWEEGTHL